MATVTIPLGDFTANTPLDITTAGVSLAASDVGKIRNDHFRRLVLVSAGAGTLTVTRNGYPDTTITFAGAGTQTYAPDERCVGSTVIITNNGAAAVTVLAR